MCFSFPELLAKFIQFETKHNNPLSDVLIFLHLFFYLRQNFQKWIGKVLGITLLISKMTWHFIQNDKSNRFLPRIHTFGLWMNLNVWTKFRNAEIHISLQDDNACWFHWIFIQIYSLWIRKHTHTKYSRVLVEAKMWPQQSELSSEFSWNSFYKSYVSRANVDNRNSWNSFC